MLGAEYRRDLNYNFMIIDSQCKEQKNYQEGMITNNSIEYFLNCSIKMVDGQKKLYYDITSKQPIKRVFENMYFSYEILSIFVQGIERSVKAAKEYLLDENSIVFDEEYIYMDIENKKLFFCFVPGRNEKIFDSLHELAEYVLKHIEHSDEKAAYLAYSFFKITMESEYSINDISNLLHADNNDALNVKKSQEYLSESHDFYENDAGSYDEESNINIKAKRKDHIKAKRKDHIKTEQYIKNKFQDEKLPDKNKHIKIKKNTKDATKSNNIKDRVFNIFLVILAMTVAVLFIKNYIAVKLTAGQMTLLICLILIISVIGLIMFKKLFPKNSQNKEQNEDLEYENQDILDNNFDDVNILNPYNINEEEGPVYYGTFEENIEQEDNIEGSAQEYGSTVVLSSLSENNIPKLKSCSKGLYEDINITKTPFIIGKMEGVSDAVIKENYISRIHFQVEIEEQQYYIRDLNSTNGTIVNGEILQTNECIAINSGDIIKVGEITYIFVYTA